MRAKLELIFFLSTLMINIIVSISGIITSRKAFRYNTTNNNKLPKKLIIISTIITGITILLLELIIFFKANFGYSFITGGIANIDFERNSNALFGSPVIVIILAISVLSYIILAIIICTGYALLVFNIGLTIYEIKSMKHKLQIDIRLNRILYKSSVANLVLFIVSDILFTSMLYVLVDSIRAIF